MYLTIKNPWIWGVSSAGRAPALQAGGHRFDPGTLHHQETDWSSERNFEVSLSFLQKKLDSRKGSGTDPEETKETERGHKTAMHLENWTLLIIDAILWEGNSKGELLTKKGKIQFLAKKTSLWACIIQLS